MIINVVIIITTILVLSILGHILKIFFDKLWLPASEKIGILIASKVKGKPWLYIFEVIFITGTLLFGITSFRFIKSDSNTIILIISLLYATFFMVEGSAYHEFRKQNNIKFQEGIIGKVASLEIWRSFFGNRSILMIEQFFSVFYLLVPLLVSYSFMYQLSWEAQYYFVMLLFLPVYSNIWVYFNKKTIFNEYNVLFMRRVTIYSLVIIFSLYDAYKKFNQVLYGITEQIITFKYLFVYISVLLYIAIDRLLKELASDFDKNKKQHGVTRG